MNTHQAPHTYQQKVMLLKSRFKNTKDLWLFMTDRRKFPLFLDMVAVFFL